MTATQGSVRVRRDEQTVIFQVEGWGRMSHSLPLRRFAEQALAAGATSLRVDLRRCTHMDSTFLGTLLQLKREAERRGQGDFALVSPSPQCVQLLRQMGLERLFYVETTPEGDAGTWTELCGEPPAGEGFKRNVIQAHEELARLDGPAGEPFREVLRCLKQDPEAKKLAKPGG